MEEETNKMDTESEDSSDDENKELEKRAEELEGMLSSNKYLYDVHLELVAVYKELSDLTSLRMAYKRFHEYFPLTPELWLAWLNEETSLASTDTEKKELISLFEKATEDYLSVKLWLQYIQYSLGCCSIEDTRKIIEKALTVAGQHVAQGSLIWDTLRELELCHVPEATSEDFVPQLQKIVTTYKRQLSVPLLYMEKTYAEWQEFSKTLSEHDIDTTSVDWCYKKALKTLQKCEPFENRLLAATENAEIWDVFKCYIQSVNDPSLTLCLYERAVEKLCLLPEVWTDYCAFAVKLGEVALNVSERALRNITWHEGLWVARLRFLEKFEQPEDVITKCFEDGIASIQGGLELWLAYLDYNKRKGSNNLMKLFEHAEQQLLPEYDPTGSIRRFHARLLTKSGDIETARSLWQTLISDPKLSSSVQYWMEYINMERQHGTVKNVRGIFARALNSCKDWPQHVGEEWLMFEREEGTLEDILKTTEKVGKVLKTVKQNYGAQTYREDKPSGSGKKRRHEEVEPKHQKRLRPDNPVKTEHMMEKRGVIRNRGPPTDLDPLKAVFVSNLSPMITDEHLKKFFPNGKVTVSTNNDGTSRFFGYVQFKTEDEATEALARDRERLEDRPIFISKCKTTKEDRETTFKYSTTVETNKLFVRGLPVKHTQEDVELLFKPYNCTNVRLVYHRSGQAKGLAYVDFANEDDTENARKALDGTTVGGLIISVAISAPPVKNKPAERNVFAAPREAGRRRLNIPLVPRVVQSKTDVPSNGKSVAKSNSDFRNMILGKK